MSVRAAITGLSGLALTAGEAAVLRATPPAGIPHHRAAAMAHMHRPRRIGRDIFDIDPAALADVAQTVVRAVRSDAAKFLDPDQPELGLVFDGRIAEEGADQAGAHGGGEDRLEELDDLTGDEELTDIPEVPGRHRADEREVPAEVFDDLHGMSIVVAAVGHEVMADLLEPARDAGRHRRLHAGFVAVELLNDHGRNQQLHLSLTNEYPQSDDPALPISTLRKVETCRGVDEEVQHEISLRGALPPRVMLGTPEPRPENQGGASLQPLHHLSSTRRGRHGVLAARQRGTESGRREGRSSSTV